ncbi:hypothetical protein HKD37_10G028307 [Glycine soja]
MDRSWMNESRINPEYEEGVEQFLQFASERGQPDEDGKYYYPCINCLNGRRQILDDIREHLLCDGIKRNYTTWIWHGEMTDMQSGQQSEPFDVDVTYDTWKEVLTAQNDLIWEDIQVEFEIPEASDSRTKKKILQIVGERWRQFKSDLTRKWALAADKDGADDIVCEKYGTSKEKWTQFCQTRRDPSWEMCGKRYRPPRSKTLPPTYCLLMAEKTKKRLEEATQSGSTKGIIDPPSPIRCHVKWKMARTKKTGQMTFEAAKEIADKIDILTAAIGRPEHPSRVRAVGAGVTIKQYFGLASQTDQLEESITEKVTRKMMASFSQMQSQFQSQMQSQGLALPSEPEVGPSGPRVSIKESCVAPSGNDPGMGDSDKCGLYIEENPSRLVALRRLYEGSTTVHNIPFLHGQVKVSVEEFKDAEALVLVPTDEVTLVGQTLNTFLAWPTHLAAVSPAKPPENPDEEVDDPLYLMTLIIPQLFLKPLQVMWDATIFGVFNQNIPLYIKHEDLSEIAHGGQCLNISVIQLWILQVCERGILMCMDSSSHSPFRDLGNHNLNPKVTSRVGYRVQNEMFTLEPT